MVISKALFINYMLYIIQNIPTRHTRLRHTIFDNVNVSFAVYVGELYK